MCMQYPYLFMYICVCIDIRMFVCVHICRALFLIALSAIPENELAMPMPSSKIVFSIRAFHICINAYIMYIFLKRSFPKHDLRT